MKVFYWNCRGASFKEFRHALLDIIQTNKPSILILAETRTRVHSSKFYKFFSNNQYDQMVCSEAQGFADSLWVARKSSEVSLFSVIIDFQIITLFVLQQ